MIKKEAMAKIARSRERSGQLSMHCVTARIYPLYYALLALPRSSPLSSSILSDYIQRKRFSAGWFPLLPARYLPGAPPSLSLSFSAFLLLLVSHICTLLLYAHPLYTGQVFT